MLFCIFLELLHESPWTLSKGGVTGRTAKTENRNTADLINTQQIHIGKERG